jgi:hypothetical protein
MCGSCLRDTDNNSSDYKDTKGIIRNRKSNDKQWDILYYYYSKKKTREKLRHFRSRDWRPFRLWVTSGHETNVTSGYDVTSGHVTDVTFGYVPRFFLTIVVVQNVPLFIIRFTVSDYSFGIFWSLCCLSFDLRLLIIPLVSSTQIMMVYTTTAILTE